MSSRLTRSGGTPKRPRGRGAAARTHRDASPQRAAPRTFSDLLGRGSSRAEQALGGDAPDGAWAAFTSSLDNFAPPSQSAPEPVALDDVEDAGAGGGATEDDSALVAGGAALTLPRDASLKRSVDVTSTRPLRWALSRAQSAECAAVARVSAGVGLPAPPRALRRLLNDTPPAPADDSTGIATPALQEFCGALLHYRYPGDMVAADVAKRWGDLVGDAPTTRSPPVSPEALKTATKRVERWQDALRSLFYAYRHGHVGYFYLRLSTTVALFERVRDGAGSCDASGYLMLGSRDEASGDRLRVSFSRATTGLREMMSEYGVHYETKDGQTKDPEPCLIVDGDKDVHALFNFVIAMGPRLSKANDVPLLISDWPFRWATLFTATPQNARRTTVAVGAGTYRYSIEIVGLFTPLQIARLYAALLVAQHREFTIHMKTEEHSSRLNVHVGTADVNKTDVSRAAVPALGASVVTRLEASAPDGKLSIFVRAAD